MADEYDDQDFDDFGGAQSPTFSAAEYESQISRRSADVRALLSRGSLAEAVRKSLENPPVGRDIQAIKDKNTAVVMDALAAVKSVDIGNVAKTLTPPEIDILMKFIYKGFTAPNLYNSALLLAWHEKATEIGGLGSITRALIDRNF